MTDDDIFRAGPIHIVGAGDFGREVLDALFAAGRTSGDLVFLDDHVAVTDPATRERLHDRMRGNGGRPVTVIHPRASLAPDVEPEGGVIVLAGTCVSAGVRLGAHCQILAGASIGSGSVLREFTTVFPGAVVASDVTVERSVTVGDNASARRPAPRR
ncbi:hypothetical protein ABZ639_05460 [Saccharomonospora sp. NPDC006951]